jgi:hypothetical protein
MLFQVLTIRKRHPPQTVPQNCSFDHQILVLYNWPNPDTTFTSDFVIEQLSIWVQNVGRPFPAEKLESLLLENQLIHEHNDEPYDIMNPFLPSGYFGAKEREGEEPTFRENMVFDLVNSRISIYDAHSVRELSLETMFQRNVTLEDFRVVRPSMPPSKEFQPKSTRFNWEPQFQTDERAYRYLGPLLTNFSMSWDHVLSGYYNQTTAKVIATAVVTIIRNSFTIEEQLEVAKPGESVPDYSTRLPMWDAIKDSDCFVGDVKILMCDDIEDGYDLAMAEAAKWKWRYSGTRPHFLILSIQHVMLARVNSPEIILYTKPEPLFLGNDVPPSLIAIDYLLYASENARPYIPTRLLDLPLEIQDCILEQSCEVGVLAGQIGCTLGLGSLFLWKHRGRPVFLLSSDPSKDAKNLPVSRLLISPKHCALIHQCP